MKYSGYRHSFFIFLLTLILSIPGAGYAQTVFLEIPFPQFTGAYDVNNFGESSASVPFPYDPAEITSVSVRISGSTTLGVLHCADQPDSPWPIEIIASMSNYPLDELWMAHPSGFLEEGSFDLVLPFETFPNRPQTWNLLDDGNGVLRFFIAPAAMIGICSGVVEPTAVIEEFVLVFEMNSVVPVDRTTWDRIKAQYR
jgi:hypothetical protein